MIDRIDSAIERFISDPKNTNLSIGAIAVANGAYRLRLIQATSDIVCEYLKHNALEAGEVPDLITGIYRRLSAAQAGSREISTNYSRPSKVAKSSGGFPRTASPR